MWFANFLAQWCNIIAAALSFQSGDLGSNTQWSQFQPLVFIIVSSKHLIGKSIQTKTRFVPVWEAKSTILKLCLKDQKKEKTKTNICVAAHYSRVKKFSYNRFGFCFQNEWPQNAINSS